MKIRLNEYELKSNKLKNDKNILVMSDIHSNIKYLNKINKLIKNINIDYILIPGDLLDYKINNKLEKESFINQLEIMSKNTKIIIALGNHDHLIKEKYKYKYIMNINNDFFDELEKNKNIKILRKKYEYIAIDDIIISAINIDIKWYQNKEKRETFKKFIDNLNQIEENKFNILLSHSPNGFIYKNNLIDYKFNSNTDLILCGHNHGGLTPYFIQKKAKKHIGLVGPNFKILKEHAYGYWNKENTSLLISNGVTKISKCSNLHKIIFWLNYIYIPDIELIHLKKGEKHQFKSIKSKIFKI